LEGFIFFVILVVFSLFRGSARQKRQQPAPPVRPRRPTLEGEPQETPGPGPAARPVRRNIFDETIYMFPKQRKAPDPAPVEREEPVVKRKEPVVVREVPERALSHGQAGRMQGLFQDRNELARGIILAEILGPPLSKRKKRGFI
jgi:hypothetical protein